MALLRLNVENTFEEAYKSFEAFCMAKNLSPVTITDYRRVKDHFLKFMGGDFSLSELTDETVIHYIDYCRSCNNNDISINTKLRHLRAIINYFVEMDYCQPVKIKLLKVTKQVKETYTNAELQKLLKKPDLKNRKCNFDDLRDWAIENYLLSTGNRLSSVINIRMADVNLPEREIILKHTKNRVQQIVPIGSALYRVLVEYLRYRQPKSNDDYLFCTWHGTKLSKSGLINSIRNYNRRRGVEKTSVHLFRHTFAKKWIMNGGDILRLQQLLGHKSLDMVKEYVALFGQDLKKDYDKFNPLSSMYTKEYIKM